MGVFLLTLMLSLFIAGAVWLVRGSRFRLTEDNEQNEWMNFAAYYCGTLPVSFVLVFFGLGGL